MKIGDYLRVLREQWPIIMIGILLGAGGAAGVFFARPPEYTAVLQMYVTAQPGNDPQAAYQSAQLSERRVKSYTELARGLRVSEEVVANLRLPMSREELASKITAVNAVDAVLIDVTVTDGSPQRAARIANEVGKVSTAVVAQLERSASPANVAPVALQVVLPAAVPSEPSSTRLPVVLGLGLLTGLLLGLGVAVSRNALDTRVKSVDDLRTVSGRPNLATIAYRRQSNPALLVNESLNSPRAESFRQLRTNLQFLDLDHPPKVVVITSATAGEGKTTTSINLGLALASAGSTVLVVDADLRRPRLSDLLRLEGGVGVTTVLTGRTPVRQAIQTWGGGKIDVLASGPLPPNPSELLASPHMKVMLDDVRQIYDFVLLDTPPLLPVTDAAAVAPSTDGVVLVCRYKKTTRQQVEGAADALRAVSASMLGTVLTMAPRADAAPGGTYDSRYNAPGVASLPAAAPSEPASAPTSPTPASPSPRPTPRPGTAAQHPAPPRMQRVERVVATQHVNGRADLPDARPRPSPPPRT